MELKKQETIKIESIGLYNTIKITKTETGNYLFESDDDSFILCPADLAYILSL